MLIGLMALGVPLIVAPLADPRLHGLRTAGFETGAASLLLLLIVLPWSAPRRQHWAESLHVWPIRLFLALFLWECLFALLAPAIAFAAQGLLQWGAGLLIVLTLSAEARARPQYALLLDALTATTFLISLLGFALYGTNHMPLAVGLYCDHMLYGAVFTVLLPILLAVSLSPVGSGRKLAAQAALVCGLIALGLAETRSSWVGLAFSLLVFGGLAFFARTMPTRENLREAASPGRNVQALVSGILAAGALVYFSLAVPQAGQIEGRLRTFATTVPQGKEMSVEWRFTAWQGAEKMIAAKPCMGWGLGGYPRYQQPWTGMGQDAAELEAHGPTIFDEAHNSYLQIAAETGLPGLLLWLGALAAALTLGIGSLRRFSSGGLRQWTLIGCLSALIGQATDALANPGWQFGEVSLFLWIALGLTIALALGPPGKEEVVPGNAPVNAMPLGLRGAKILVAALVGGGLLWIILRTMSILPAPMLSP